MMLICRNRKIELQPIYYWGNFECINEDICRFALEGKCSKLFPMAQKLV